jgi:PIN domain nuclease of toxin-antitoxin system
MRYLLDTHVWLWSLFETKRIASKAMRLLEDPKNEVYLSVASLWEVAIKYGKGTLELPLPPATCFARSIENKRRTSLAIEPRHVLATVELERRHADPFDRLLVAQAMEEGMVLVTHDTQLRQYPCRLLMT